MSQQTTALVAAQQMTNLSRRTPVEIDTTLADLDGEYGQLTGHLHVTVERLHSIAGDRKRDNGRRRRTWGMSDTDAITAAADKIAANTVDLSFMGAADTLARYHALTEQIAANRVEFDRLDAEYERRRWTRFITCVHIHSGYWCVGGTLRPTSERHWLPEFSGMNEAAAIAELNQRAAHGAETLCTHCFPNAPVVTKAPEPGVCPSTRPDPTAPKRTGYAYGNFGTCYCGTQAPISKIGNLRKHQQGPNPLPTA